MLISPFFVVFCLFSQVVTHHEKSILKIHVIEDSNILIDQIEEDLGGFHKLPGNIKLEEGIIIWICCFMHLGPAWGTLVMRSSITFSFPWKQFQFKIKS